MTSPQKNTTKLASHTLDTTAQNTAADVVITQENTVLRVLLNRPSKLNALTTQMCRDIRQTLTHLNQKITLVLFESSNPRGFCGGGDVKAMAQSPTAALEFLREEYAMDEAIAKCPVPTVALTHGITMGGGIGIAAHCNLRIVAPESTLAMPETRIGIVPDVGINRILAATPPGFGELIAATSASFNAAAALQTGFADYCLDKAGRAELLAQILAGADPYVSAKKLAIKTQTSEIISLAAELIAAYEEQTVHESTDWAAAAMRYLQVLRAHPQAEEYTSALEKVSPLAAALAFARVRKLRAAYTAGKTQSVTGALLSDYKIVGSLVQQQNFREGVRARLIDKDDNPKWQPATLAEVTAAEVIAALAA